MQRLYLGGSGFQALIQALLIIENLEKVRPDDILIDLGEIAGIVDAADLLGQIAK